MRPLSATWISCGVLRAELGELLRLGRIRGRQSFLDSMLHMDPPGLEARLLSVLEGLGPEAGPEAGPGAGPGTGPVVLVFGDCCPRMLDLAGRSRLSRVDAINCAQMLVGRARYQALMAERAFMVLPEWAPRWKEVFKTELGLSEDNARDLMGEHHGSLVYLDPGLAPVPRESLAACADYTGLPWRVERVRLDKLHGLLAEAVAARAVASAATAPPPRPTSAKGQP